MQTAALSSQTDFEGWRTRARALLAANVRPDDVRFHAGGSGGGDLFADKNNPSIAPGRGDTDEAIAIRVPRAFIERAEQAALHSDEGRFDLLYRILWRLQGIRDLIDVASDPDIARLDAMVKAVRRDIHKMHAFVRFKRVEDIRDGEMYAAWYEPDHYVVEAAAPFFARRFASMNFAILTPYRSVFHESGILTFGLGAERKHAPAEDELDELWCRYYASTFNPARPKPGAMRNEMPVRFWKNLPEAKLIRPLLQGAGRRAEDMIAAAPTAPVARRGAEIEEAPPMASDDADSLEILREAAASCRLCPLWEPATQTVFGEGEATARLFFVGEQPGDQEDLAGRPFVGPAGQIFDRALKDAGIARGECYVTNAVKHFKFEPRGKRRLHKKPAIREIRACSAWLQRELSIVQPTLVVMLGASAAQAVLGRAVTISRERGIVMSLPGGRRGFITAHPSSILRAQDEPARDAAYSALVRDLVIVTRLMAGAAEKL